MLDSPIIYGYSVYLLAGKAEDNFNNSQRHSPKQEIFLLIFKVRRHFLHLCILLTCCSSFDDCCNDQETHSGKYQPGQVTTLRNWYFSQILTCLWLNAHYLCFLKKKKKIYLLPLPSLPPKKVFH